ncbi:uncharacterized protein DNG_02671 [Cephalotrichum gorgonifer]|uniref:Mediator of RNA polymerase II transcription subunit 17 n=1 Tax=Cephalotrichum gorgonifer TaxID=2041049 RepID=A0AAE8SSU1_9PEZI|nr:uncharacterized protein DNG_02671 [Cephalotrichum gorgonifer]
MDSTPPWQNSSLPCPVRPWPIPNADRGPKSISDYIALVNQTHPGGFRALNVDKLKEGIQDGDEPADTKMSDSDVADDADDEPGARDPLDARNEALFSINTAHHSALFALDLVSLLLTKENPTGASFTLRQDLRDLVGIGTLASQKHAESNLGADKLKDLGQVTAGWNILAIGETRESAQKAAALLEKETEKEAKYWADVLSVSESGWSVCRLPRERHTLGVRFGFNEASSEFKKYSLAPMRRATDGSVELDLGILGGQSQRLVVTVERDGKVTGTSTLDAPLPEGENAPLSAHVLEARNTVFSRELWHELQMEARTLLSYDVKQYESCIIYTTKQGVKIRLELLSLDEIPPRQEELTDNTLAESVHIALHILLSHAHRQNETLRSRPLPPNQPRGRLQNQYHLLRPIIARMIHLDAIKECTNYVGNLVKSLRNAKIADAKFELLTAPHALADLSSISNERAHVSPSQSLLSSITTPLFFAVDLTITPGNRISIIGHTWLLPATTTIYQINLPTTNADTPNTLLETCPPHRDYPSILELRCYINQAVSCALASTFQPLMEQSERARQSETVGSLSEAEGYDSDQEGFWLKSVAETTLAATAASTPREIVFSVAGPVESLHLEVKTLVRTKEQSAEVVRHVWGADEVSTYDGEGSGDQGLADVCEDLVARAYK